MAFFVPRSHHEMLSRSGLVLFITSSGINTLLRDGSPSTDYPSLTCPAYQTFSPVYVVKKSLTVFIATRFMVWVKG